MEFIILNNLTFHSHIGHYDEEKIVGTNFIVDIKIQTSLIKAGITDKLENTINYLDIYQIIKKYMAIKSNLVERPAYLICNEIFDSFEQVKHIELTLKKIDTQIGGKKDYIAITFDFEREEWFKRKKEDSF